MRAGATCYLGVNVEGALLSLGDGHARQGEGETCGVAVETAMNTVVDRRADQGRGHPVAAAGDRRLPDVDRIGAPARGRVPHRAARPRAVGRGDPRTVRARRLPTAVAGRRITAGERVRHELHVGGEGAQAMAARRSAISTACTPGCASAPRVTSAGSAQPPAIAPMTRNGSLPAATAAGSGASGVVVREILLAGVEAHERRGAVRCSGRAACRAAPGSAASSASITPRWVGSASSVTSLLAPGQLAQVRGQHDADHGLLTTASAPRPTAPAAGRGRRPSRCRRSRATT